MLDFTSAKNPASQDAGQAVHVLFSVYVCQCVINHCELNIICCVGVMDASVFKHIPHYAPCVS